MSPGYPYANALLKIAVTRSSVENKDKAVKNLSIEKGVFINAFTLLDNQS